MAKRKPEGAPLVIVESPAKARTIAKFLGSDYVIEASVGHIRDLPANASEVPAAVKKEKWSRLGIDIENNFAPLYVVPKEKKEQLKRLKGLLKDASMLYLATDEDREGESISWHLLEELKPKVEYKRLVFHEITKAAIQHAIDTPRDLDLNLVEAQETRRLMDRLYGYEVSPLLWKKIKPRLSAGRVQTVAVRLVIEREYERMRFVSSEYFTVEGRFKTQRGEPLTTNLVEVEGQRVAVGKDFDPDTGALKNPDKVLQLTAARAQALCDRLASADARVHALEQKPFTERPSPPFTTSTLQQEASSKLGFTAKRTMSTAQRLYENGFITYMRTDSTTLSKEALSAARSLIGSRYGAENVPDEPRSYHTKVKNAQEAHEAIRPAGANFQDPKSIPDAASEDERRLYDLIWKRTVASQMKDAHGMRTQLTIAVDDARFQANGRVIQFPGFRLAYVSQSDSADAGSDKAGAEDGETQKAGTDGDRILPSVAEGEAMTQSPPKPYAHEGHATKPPARLTEASLIRELEKRGIGRPSTYASIIDTILRREYCFKKGTALVPTFTAFAVINLMQQHLDHLVDYTFTARMEDDLDEISNGKEKRLEYLKRFYHGNGKPGLRESLDRVTETIDPRQVCTLSEFALGETEDGNPIEVRVGRYGPFLSCDGTSASLPDGLAPDELSRDMALKLIKKAKEGPKSLGSDPESGLPIFVKVGRFGPYFQRGDAESLGDEKPKMASLLPGMDPDTVTLELALRALALPRTVGTRKDPESGDETKIQAANGRFGPYLKWGKETRSVPAGESLLDITLERANELFDQPKARGRTRAAPKVLREMGEHPSSKAEIKILDGRYGPYVSDGETNASLPQGETPDDLSMERAVELLEARAKSPGKKKKVAKKAAKKKVAKKATKKATNKTSKKAPSPLPDDSEEEVDDE